MKRGFSFFAQKNKKICKNKNSLISRDLVKSLLRSFKLSPSALLFYWARQVADPGFIAMADKAPLSSLGKPRRSMWVFFLASLGFFRCFFFLRGDDERGWNLFFMRFLLFGCFFKVACQIAVSFGSSKLPTLPSPAWRLSFHRGKQLLCDAFGLPSLLHGRPDLWNHQSPCAHRVAKPNVFFFVMEGGGWFPWVVQY